MKYCIENKQYTKEEYEKIKSEILASSQTIEETKVKYNELRSKALVKYALMTKCNNVTGDNIFNCYDGDSVFDATDAKNSSYVADAEAPLDCQDCNNLYMNPERVYNVMSTLQTTNCIVGTYIFYSSEVNYSDCCYTCNSCFGCAGLNKKNYHILNKEYSKEEYSIRREKIVKELKAQGIYGDFFDP
ncbi:hypothetical protein K2P96_02695, partial [Patescibacteria group bacterium]|nr:hypothetical protein [Patescibacteria group bacterium]